MNEYSNDLSEEKKYYKMDISTEENDIKISTTNTKKNVAEPLLDRSSVRLLSYNFFARPPPVNTNGTDYKAAMADDSPPKVPNGHTPSHNPVFPSPQPCRCHTHGNYTAAAQVLRNSWSFLIIC